MMTEERNDAAVGRVLRERKEVESHLAMLETDARKASQRLARLAHLLDESPQDVWFYGESVDVKGYAPRSPSLNIADFDIQRIVDITNEIRDAREKLDRLNAEASRLGF